MLGRKTKTHVVVNTCMFCNKPNRIEMPDAAFRKWKAGAFLQDAWPEATADQREVVISGTHAECWDKMFGTEMEY